MIDCDLLCSLSCIQLCFVFYFVFFKQSTAYEMRISDWSSDVCSSDLFRPLLELAHPLLADAEGFAELLQRGAVVGEAPRADDGLLALAQLQQGLLDPLVAGQAVVDGDNQVFRA